MNRLIVFMVMLLMTCSHSFSAEVVKVYLLAGQSNMHGQGATADLPAELQSPQQAVLFFYAGNSSLTTLRPGSGKQFGPEISFGRTIADALPAESFALIKRAKGGTNMKTDWNPEVEDNVYSDFRATVAEGLAAMESAGYSPRIVGMLWTQGERDAKINRSTAQYEADLNRFIADIRVRYGENLPFFISRLSLKQTSISAGQLQNIRTAQENVAESDAHTKPIDTDEFSVKSDNLHFDSAGQLALGQAFADSFLQGVNKESALIESINE